MNRKQKMLLTKITAVLLITAAAAVAMVNFRDYVNRSEAMTAMQQLAEKITQYRQQYGSIPPRFYVEDIKSSLQGYRRLGNLHYRAQWIDLDALSDEILAYTLRKRSSIPLRQGYVVMRLDGRVEWMQKQPFERLLAERQSQIEIQMTPK